ncbi:hypothetical protein Tco_1463849, partial [Tanacetum coccineum]
VDLEVGCCNGVQWHCMEKVLLKSSNNRRLPNWIVGDLLQPSGYLNLIELGLEGICSCYSPTRHFYEGLTFTIAMVDELSSNGFPTVNKFRSFKWIWSRAMKGLFEL